MNIYDPIIIIQQFSPCTSLTPRKGALPWLSCEAWHRPERIRLRRSLRRFMVGWRRYHPWNRWSPQLPTAELKHQRVVGNSRADPIMDWRMMNNDCSSWDNVLTSSDTWLTFFWASLVLPTSAQWEMTQWAQSMSSKEIMTQLEKSRSVFLEIVNSHDSVDPIMVWKPAE